MHNQIKKLDESARLLRSVHTNLSNMQSDSNMISLKNQMNQSIQLLHNINAFIKDSVSIYNSMEQSITNNSERLSNLKRKSDWNSKFFDFDKSGSFKLDHELSLKTVGMLGASVKGKLEFHGFKTDKMTKNDKTNTKIAIQAMNVGVQVEGSGIVFDNGKFAPSLRLKVEAKASMLAAKANWNYDGKHVGLHAGVSAEVGAAHGEVKAVVSKDEISAKAEWGVAALRGEVQGGISIFGFRINATLGGEVLGVGGGAEFKKESNSFEIGGKLSFIFGLDFKIKITH